LVAAASLFVRGALLYFTRQRLNEQAQRRAMAEAEFAAILSERNRLAREIHDTMAQGLTAMSVQLQLALIHGNGASEVLLQHLNAVQQLVRGSLEEARNSIWNMRSQVLETKSLARALEGILTQMVEGTGVETKVLVLGRERRLAPMVENNLLRVGQEAITNATKHARANHITVTLDFGEEQLTVAIADNGCGFNPSQPHLRKGGFGLVGMQERATDLKGELTISTSPGQGTKITLHVPLSPE
jgi:signal transduction histidine kinase